MTRILFLLLVIMLTIQQSVVFWCTGITLKGDQDKALYGHSFRNISDAAMANCLAQCLANCRCMSFQICDDRKCQLCSTNKYRAHSALRDSKGCINYNFNNKEITKKVGDLQCDLRCKTILNCCMTSNPCDKNGETCKPQFSDRNSKRYRCTRIHSKSPNNNMQ